MPLSQRLHTTGHLIAIQVQAANRHIWRALLSLVSAALLLRLGGMVNQVVISAKFGAGSAMDAYFVAAAFPLLLIQLISSAIEAAVIPVYSQLRMHASKEATSRLFSTLLNGLALGATLLALVLFVLRRQFVFFSAPGLDAARLDLAVSLTPLLVLVIPPGLVIGLLECVLNAEGQFGWPAYAGLLVPLVTALLALLGGRIWGIEVLCLGVFLGTLCQLAIVWVRARRAKLRYQPIMDVRNPYLWRILRAGLPVLLGALISQGGPLVDQTVPGDPEYRAFKGMLRLYLWVIGLCALALSLLLLLLARPLVQVLFQRGAFSEVDTSSTVLIVSGFAVGLMPMAIVFLLTRAFNALGETRIPMYIACVSVCANAVFDAPFASLWQGFGIALATSMVSCMSSGLLLFMLSRRIGTLHLWHIPDEILSLFTRLRQRRQPRTRERFLDALSLSFCAGGLRQGLLMAGITLLVLAAGVYATVHDGLTTLRAVSGMLIALCFLRYPFLLLLAWASIDVGIGSSLAFLNGNNRDLLLIGPLLLLLWTLPWREVASRMPGLPWLALYLAWVLIGIGFSPLDTRTFLTFWLTMVASIGVGALVIGLVKTRRRLLRLIDTLLATALLVALYGLYGSVTHQRGEVDPETQLFRVTSLFTQATTFAFYLSSVIPLALYRCWTLRGAKRLVCASAAFCLLAALALTFTRSACIGLLLMALCLPARRTRLCVIAGLFGSCGLAIILALSGYLPFLNRFLNGDSATLNGRIYLWQALLSRFEITRWLGNGLQASDQLLAYLRVGNDGQGLIGSAPHSLFLGTLYDHGLIGLVLLCAIFLSIGRRLLKGIRGSSGERRVLCAAALAVLVSVFLQSLVSRDLWIQAAGLPFWIAVALASALCWSQSKATLDTREMSVTEMPESSLEALRVPVPVNIYI